MRPPCHACDLGVHLRTEGIERPGAGRTLDPSITFVAPAACPRRLPLREERAVAQIDVGPDSDRGRERARRPTGAEHADTVDGACGRGEFDPPVAPGVRSVIVGAEDQRATHSLKVSRIIGNGSPRSRMGLVAITWR